MPILTWTDSYSIGNDFIDNQHKKLFMTLNRLYDSFVFNVTNIEYQSAVDRLLDSTRRHFAAEEEFMREFSYCNFFEHAQEHQSFIKKAIELKATTVADNRTRTKELIEFLSGWIVNHEIAMDSKILAKQNAESAPRPDKVNPYLDHPRNRSRKTYGSS